jgi:hypothetical protein
MKRMGKPLKVTVVTTCTKKKLATPWASIPKDKKFDTQQEFLAAWREQLASCPEKRKMAASALYRGRGFQRVMLNVAQPEDVLVLSAGLGLVKATDDLVPYNLTTSSGSPNHVKHNILGAFSDKLWWKDLTQDFSLQSELPNRKGLILVGLSRSYLSMVVDDLMGLPDDVKARLRLFGSDLEEEMPFELFDKVMPYDNRLNLPSSPLSGSKIDFSARALQHFFQKILPDLPEGTAEEHAKAVHAFISSLGTIEQATKEAVDDLEIRRIVDEEWDACFGRFTRILQTIRKKYGYACSEQRLKRILQERVDDAEEEPS